MRFKKFVTGAIGTAAVMLFAVPAGAFVAGVAGGTAVTDLVGPNDVSGTTDRVEVVKGTTAFNGDNLVANFKGFAANSANPTYRAVLCNPKIAAGVFNAATDCISLTSSTPTSTTGTGVINDIKTGDGGHTARAVNGDIDWECDSTGSPAGTVDPTDYGVGPTKVYNECYVVIREGSPFEADPAKNELFPVRFVAGGPGPVVPEAPFAVLLPLGALAAVGGAYLILRRRQPVMA
jgi:hypothetical protein